MCLDQAYLTERSLKCVNFLSAYLIADDILSIFDYLIRKLIEKDLSEWLIPVGLHCCTTYYSTLCELHFEIYFVQFFVINKWHREMRECNLIKIHVSGGFAIRVYFKLYLTWFHFVTLLFLWGSNPRVMYAMILVLVKPLRSRNEHLNYFGAKPFFCF